MTCSSLILSFSPLSVFQQVVDSFLAVYQLFPCNTYMPRGNGVLTDWPPGALWERKHQGRNWFPLFLLLLCLFCSCRVLINVIKGLLCWSFKEVTSLTWSADESWEYNVKGIGCGIVGSAQNGSSACSLSTSHTCSCSASAPPITLYASTSILVHLCCVQSDGDVIMGGVHTNKLLGNVNN